MAGFPPVITWGGDDASVQRLRPPFVMGKLSGLPNRLAGLPAPVGFQRDEHGHSPAAEPWRAWYSSAEWKALRLATFKRDGFRCRCCGELEARMAKLVADHIKPHRGNRALFFDPANVQTLRKFCHDSRKQSEERKAPWQLPGPRGG